MPSFVQNSVVSLHDCFTELLLISTHSIGFALTYLMSISDQMFLPYICGMQQMPMAATHDD
jgi:hypothetical protein